MIFILNANCLYLYYEGNILNFISITRIISYFLSHLVNCSIFYSYQLSNFIFIISFASSFYCNVFTMLKLALSRLSFVTIFILHYFNVLFSIF